MAERTVRQSPSASHQACPFWLDAAQSCSLYEKGLFLPGTEHVRLFCRHENFHSCTHYVDSVRCVSSDPVAQTQDNKRRSRRIPIRVSLQLVNPASEGVVQLIDDTAQTVDISAVGLRFESRVPVRVGTCIEFALGQETASSPLLRGFGHIKWCHSLENAPLYHAGISFADESIAQAIRSQLDLL